MAGQGIHANSRARDCAKSHPKLSFAKSEKMSDSPVQNHCAPQARGNWATLGASGQGCAQERGSPRGCQAAWVFGRDEADGDSKAHG